MATEIQQAKREIGGLQIESITETAEGRADMVVNMGPQHPSTHGVLRVVLDLQGENIVGSQVHIGYLHRGIEKLAESRTYTQIIPLTDRTDYTAAMTGNQGLCVAIERLMELEVPIRARYIRTMIAELQRVASHLVWLGTHALDIGAATVFLYCFRERERILDFFEQFSGARLTYSYYRVGGVLGDAPAGILQQIFDFTTELVDRLAENEELLTGNDIWLARTKGVGLISGPEAIAIGLTGPSLRGSGVAYDIRKSEPYDAYADMDFDIPTFTDGDVFARYQVRIEEIKQSVRIIRQCIEKMPTGPVNVEDSRVTPPKREVAMTHMESMINHFMWNIHSFSAPPGEIYSAVESPKGELGYYIVSDGSNKPYRLRIRPPSFCNLQALPLLMKGQMIADVVACIGSIDIVLGEVDQMSGRGPTLSMIWDDSYEVDEVDNIVERNKWRRGGALEMLEDIQEHFGWVSPAAIQRMSDLTEWSPNFLYGIVTFYDEFRIAPPGTARVDICNGSACALNREDAILHVLERFLRLEEITDTSPYELFSQNKFGYVSDDGKVLLRKVDCVGACQLAPLFRVMKEGHEAHHEAHFVGPVTADQVETRLKEAFSELGLSLPETGHGTHAPGDRFERGNLGL